MNSENKPRHPIRNAVDMIDDLVTHWTNPPEILLVDDDPDVLSVLTHGIQSLGCRVTIAHTGAEALAYFRNILQSRFQDTGATAHPYDLIYLDLHLPDMRGEDVLREIRSLWPPQPVIIITGNTGVAWTQWGVVGVAEKPLDVNALKMSLVMHNIRMPARRGNSRPPVSYT
jgi:CheY-like chemotaxis protein